MFLFYSLVYIVISLVNGQENSTQTQSTTLLPVSTSESTAPTLLPTSTSVSPISTTTEILSTTTEVLTTTQAPLTTKPPRPEEGTWNVTDGNVTCIRAKLAIEIHIPSQNTTIFLSPKASSTQSSCNISNTTQALVLEYENYILEFEFVKDDTTTYFRNVSFIDTFTPERTDVFYNDTKLHLHKNGHSFLCKTVDSLHLGPNATMYVYEIQIQAFATADETDFGKVDECELDDIVSDIVPIAVSCALAGLIIIVLIAYLIGRRRNRQRGYTSV